MVRAITQEPEGRVPGDAEGQREQSGRAGGRDNGVSIQIIFIPGLRQNPAYQFPPPVRGTCCEYLNNFANYFHNTVKRFNYPEHKTLMKMITRASFGDAHSLSTSQKSYIEECYKKIRYNSEIYSEAIGVLEVEVYYICLAKYKRKGFSSMEPITDSYKVSAVYAVKKCRGPDGQTNYCRVFIDSNFIVYSTWKNFLNENSLPMSMMCVPRHGRYTYNENGILELDFIQAPRTKLSYIAMRIYDVLALIICVGSGFAISRIGDLNGQFPLMLFWLILCLVQVAYIVIRLIIYFYKASKHKRFQWSCSIKDPVKYQNIQRKLVKCTQCSGHYYKNK